MNPSANSLQSPAAGTPAAIVAEVNSVNPMRREDVAKSFVGAQIDWTQAFFGAKQSSGSMTKINMFHAFPLPSSLRPGDL